MVDAIVSFVAKQRTMYWQWPTYVLVLPTFYLCRKNSFNWNSQKLTVLVYCVLKTNLHYSQLGTYYAMNQQLKIYAMNHPVKSWLLNVFTRMVHCVKNVQIRSFFWSIFSVQIQENTDQKKLSICTLFTQWFLHLCLMWISKYM